MSINKKIEAANEIIRSVVGSIVEDAYVSKSTGRIVIADESKEVVDKAVENILKRFPLYVFKEYQDEEESISYLEFKGF